MLQGIRITYRIRANQGVKYETWSISSYNNVYEAEITMLGTDTKHKTKANKKNNSWNIKHRHKSTHKWTDCRLTQQHSGSEQTCRHVYVWKTKWFSWVKLRKMHFWDEKMMVSPISVHWHEEEIEFITILRPNQSNAPNLMPVHRSSEDLWFSKPLLYWLIY